LGGAGYRGAALDEHDLWRTLADPDADVDLRAGVARALVRIAPETALEKVEAAVAAMRDPHEAKRIRVALHPDIEKASRLLEELEEEAASRLLRR
jgi:hypothetical protein